MKKQKFIVNLNFKVDGIKKYTEKEFIDYLRSEFLLYKDLMIDKKLGRYNDWYIEEFLNKWYCIARFSGLEYKQVVIALGVQIFSNPSLEDMNLAMYLNDFYLTDEKTQDQLRLEQSKRPNTYQSW